MMDYCFADDRPEAAHAIGQPPRDLSTVQRQIRGSSSLSHQSNVSRIRAAAVDRIWFTFAPAEQNVLAIK